MTPPIEEVLLLASRQLEDKLSVDDEVRLATLLESDPTFVEAYTDLLSLHAQLSWDAGLTVPAATLPSSHPDQATAELINTPRTTRRRSWFAGLSATIAVAMLMWAVFAFRPFASPIPELAEGDPPQEAQSPASVTEDANGLPDFSPIQLAHQGTETPSTIPSDGAESADDSPTDFKAEDAEWLAAKFTDDEVVAKIDNLLQQSWTQSNVQPGVLASDAEWIRRLYLSLAGRIPTVAEAEAFINSESPRRKNAELQKLLCSSERSDHFATVWTNLMVGRTEKQTVNRDMLFDFMADQFDQNVPWIDTVGDLITATGRNDQNGATNFLLAHLNNQATPATAVTARLFLGEQISCVQCHDHPFSKSVRQEDYWALNAFFKDTVRIREPEAGSSSRYVTCRLADRATVERITHYETLSGQQKAVLPKYDGTVIPQDSTTNRRRVLAGLLSRDSDTRIARAMVNRLWAHFFGYGFTNPVDDMGSHSVVSHPRLLDLLTEAFVKSDYDLRRLSFWITSSRAWQLSSVAPAESVDLPEHGEVPLFTRVYPQRMSPEQVYESVRVAIRSSSDQPLQHTSETLNHRRRWVQQFAKDYGTDENDEVLNFGGTITQALVMMNGEEVERAVRQAALTIVQSATGRRTPQQLLHRVSLAAVSRFPTDAETQAFRTHLRQLSRRPTSESLAQGVEDMLWAYLNSSEFVLIH